MISEAHGNLLNAEVDALVNTVNTVGVMGKGIALQFKRAFPAMFKDYERAAKRGDLHLGRMHVWPTNALSGPAWVINFPTKGHWRAKSKLTDIDAGLADLVSVVRSNGIRSIAVPPLGCGNGGLQWHQVAPLIEAAFAGLPDVDVQVFPPEGTPGAATLTTNTPRPKWTLGKAALVNMLQRYSERALEVSLIEVQKLMYFLQAAGEPLNLNYTKGIYGPYAENLRHSLMAVEGHFLVGFGDGTQPVLSGEPLDVLPGAATEAECFLADFPDSRSRIARVLELSEGFESAYAMELLSTVHWVVCAGDEPSAVRSPAEAARVVSDWSPRKQRMFGPDHVASAWTRLDEGHWLPPTEVNDALSRAKH